jgi:hypothetical protein
MSRKDMLNEASFDFMCTFVERDLQHVLAQCDIKQIVDRCAGFGDPILPISSKARNFL